MDTFELISHWIQKVFLWLLVPVLIFGAIIVGVIWGETKKGIRS